MRQRNLTTTLDWVRPGPRKYKSIDDRQILKLLANEIIRVNLRTAEIQRFRQGCYYKVVKYRDKAGRAWIRIHYQGGRRGIMVNKLVWMAKHMRAIPRKFDVHHKDLNNQNDTAINLVLATISSNRSRFPPTEAELQQVEEFLNS